MSEQDTFINYYYKELSYLRNAGAEFARLHPKIAKRLDFRQMGESPDPHLERLLESFAFLTARLSLEIDDRMPQIAAALLETLYPQMMAPLPSASIAQFQIDPTQSKLTTAYTVPQHTPLYTYAEEGVSCRFLTTYDVTLWPIVVKDARIVPASYYAFEKGKTETSHFLALKLYNPLGSLQDLDIQSLTFFINADRTLAFLLYELLFAQQRTQVAVSREPGKAIFLSEGSLSEMGFQSDQALLPAPEQNHPSYQFLQEYFHFPEKFLFFSVNNLSFKDCTSEAEILISLDSRAVPKDCVVGPDNFLLGCSPIINLFSRITDPLRIDHRKIEYRFVADQRRERTMEIHSLTKVVGVRDSQSEERVYKPYFSFDHEATETDQQVFWVNRRVPSLRPGIEGHDMYLSFVDFSFNPVTPPDETVYAHVWCTNRFLATQVPAKAKLESEDPLPVFQIVSLHRPVPSVHTPRNGETLWKLISQLSVDYLSLASGSQAAQALKEGLRLFSGGLANHSPEIDAIRSLYSEPTVCRMGTQAWRGFVKGLRVCLEVEDRLPGGNSTFLLARVLQAYLAQRVSINSFVELTLYNKKEVWKQWLPQAGDQKLL